MRLKLKTLMEGKRLFTIGRFFSKFPQEKKKFVSFWSLNAHDHEILSNVFNASFQDKNYDRDYINDLFSKINVKTLKQEELDMAISFMSTSKPPSSKQEAHFNVIFRFANWHKEIMSLLKDIKIDADRALRLVKLLIGLSTCNIKFDDYLNFLLTDRNMSCVQMVLHRNLSLTQKLTCSILNLGSSLSDESFLPMMFQIIDKNIRLAMGETNKVSTFHFPWHFYLSGGPLRVSREACVRFLPKYYSHLITSSDFSFTKSFTEQFFDVFIELFPEVIEMVRRYNYIDQDNIDVSENDYRESFLLLLPSFNMTLQLLRFKSNPKLNSITYNRTNERTCLITQSFPSQVSFALVVNTRNLLIRHGITDIQCNTRYYSQTFELILNKKIGVKIVKDGQFIMAITRDSEGSPYSLRRTNEIPRSYQRSQENLQKLGMKQIIAVNLSEYSFEKHGPRLEQFVFQKIVSQLEI
jgi:hypothetical protein